MKKTLIFLLLLVIIGGVAYWLLGKPSGTDVGTSPSPTVTASDQYGQTTSDGVITFGHTTDYALATNAQQVTVTSYIPPCEQGFTYCLYYNGDAYKNTNFESAGLRIQKRTDLKTQASCMNTMPTGYTRLTQGNASGTGYTTSVFSPFGDAGAGHYSSGAEYRLWTSNTCYEFETRLGQTQFANYPAGTITEFSATDQANVNAQLRAMIDHITINNGESVSFPQPQS